MILHHKFTLALEENKQTWQSILFFSRRKWWYRYQTLSDLKKHITIVFINFLHKLIDIFDHLILGRSFSYLLSHKLYLWLVNGISSRILPKMNEAGIITAASRLSFVAKIFKVTFYLFHEADSRYKYFNIFFVTRVVVTDWHWSLQLTIFDQSICSNWKREAKLHPARILIKNRLNFEARSWIKIKMETFTSYFLSIVCLFKL